MTKITSQRTIDSMTEALEIMGYFTFNGYAVDPSDDTCILTESRPLGCPAAMMALLIQSQDDAREELFMLQHHDSEIPAEMMAGRISPDTRDRLVRRIRSRLHTARREWQPHSLYRIRLQEWSLNDLRVLLAANRKS